MSSRFIEEEKLMNRIELIALFTSIERFLEKEDYESIEIIVKKILKEAEKNKD